MTATTDQIPSTIPVTAASSAYITVLTGQATLGGVVVEPEEAAALALDRDRLAHEVQISVAIEGDLELPFAGVDVFGHAPKPAVAIGVAGEAAVVQLAGGWGHR